ncbi:MAG: hypothetical protein ABII74_10330 [Elusimicrobiota bacterium]
MKIIKLLILSIVLLVGLQLYFYYSMRQDVLVFTERAEYHRYEIVPLYVEAQNIFLQEQLKKRELEIIIFSDEEKNPLVTIGGKKKIQLRFNPEKKYWQGSWPVPWNAQGKFLCQLNISPPLTGKYKIKTTGFSLSPRKVKDYAAGLRVLTLESNVSWAAMRITSPEGEVKDWRGLLDWVKFAQANTFWCLFGQTAAFSGKLDPDFPWLKNNLGMIPQMAGECHRRGLKFGGWVMAYLAFGKRSLLPEKYQYAWDYKAKTGELFLTRSISLNDPRRLEDLISFFKMLNEIPELDYIGIDYIRNALGGYELVDDFVREMEIALPAGWEKYTPQERMLWLAKKKVARKDLQFIEQWEWWRAHRTALIIKKICQEVKFTKPFFAYTLSWEKGWQHGQDPVMFYDAGVDIDAIMLYECNRSEYADLVQQWRAYLKEGQANLIIGDIIDWPLHQYTLNPAGPEEFYYRNLQAIEKFYPDGLIKGVFLHDLGRALWGRIKPYSSLEWLFVGGAVCSRIAEIVGESSFKVEMELPAAVRLNEEFTLKVKLTKFSPVSTAKIKLFFSPGVICRQETVQDIQLKDKITALNFTLRISEEIPLRGLRYFIGFQGETPEGGVKAFKYLQLTGTPAVETEEIELPPPLESEFVFDEKDGPRIEELLMQENLAVEKLARKLTLAAPIILVVEKLKEITAGGNKRLVLPAKKALKIYEKCLDPERSSAGQYLAKLIKKKKTDLICVSLKNSDLSIKILAAYALGESADLTVVPSLISELEENRKIIAGEDWEEQPLRRKFLITLVEALEKLTRQDFQSIGLIRPNNEVNIPQFVEETIRRTRRYLEENKNQ